MVVPATATYSFLNGEVNFANFPFLNNMTSLFVIKIHLQRIFVTSSNLEAESICGRGNIDCGGEINIIVGKSTTRSRVIGVYLQSMKVGCVHCLLSLAGLRLVLVGNKKRDKSFLLVL